MVRGRLSRQIDLMHLGRDRVICAYEWDGLVVDPGPSTCLDTLVGALDAEPRALLLTHIHLDHAGAAGSLVRRFPDLLVYVHERGAPHLVDPSKLLASAERLYGGEMERLWGEVLPVPEANLRVLSGGEQVEGCRVAYTPGHASHHVSYLHEASGDAYVGDTAGVRILGEDIVFPPTPPPDIDIEKWHASLDLVASWEPAALCVTHFGRFEDVEFQIAAVRERLDRWAEFARGSDQASFVAAVKDELRSEVEPDAVARYEQAVAPDQIYMGLERYWRKRAEREAA
jgi:glyoxylase-like metal-dependent hydrolase (beta-lactamase superfamily II)